MNQAVLYSKYNGLQRNDAIFVLDNYYGLLMWKNDGEEAVLDIGCGSGDITEGLLLPVLPKKFGKLVGVDLSQEMVDFARSQRKNNKIFYNQLDLLSEEIPVDFEENFDHVFSFYCLHWIQNQRKALQNILAMIKPGGDMLVTFLASNPIFDIYEALSKNKRWKPYVSNFKKFVSPYQNSKNPVEELEEHLTKVGFKIHLCKIEERLYIYPNIAVLKKSVTAVSPFINKIPENQREDYLEDYLSEVKKLGLIENNDNNNEARINVPYKLFIVHASKPI